jgi:hypothetical protein
VRTRLLLLAGQTVLLGLFCAFLVVPASALFLARYGADDLAYAYLGVAVAGILVSWGMRAAQTRMSLSALAESVIVLFLVLVGLAWLVLKLGDGLWVTFPLVVLFPVSIPVGFVLVGSQAGRLMDVREMKASFPRVVAGFSLGFAGGGLSAAWLVGVFDGPVPVLGFAPVAAAVWLALAALTSRRYRSILRARPEPAGRRAGSTRKPVSLLRNPFVLAVFGYQVLSAAVTQLLDYMVWERAAARYPDASDLAQFQGIFGATINIVAIVFIVALAGRVVTRLGVGAGLAANPLGVLAVLGVTVVVGYGGGFVGLTFLLLACATQVVDITLTDGTTRTSVNATYQALPAGERLAAQTGVEAAGVPLALGFVGALLLLFRALSFDVRAVGVVTFALTVAWFVLARFAARHYATGLRDQFSRPQWDPQPLRAQDDADRAAAERLLASPDVRDVQIAIGALASGGHPALVQIEGLLDDPDPRVRLRAAAVIAGADGDRGAHALRLWVSAIRGDDLDAASAALVAAAEHPAPCFLPELVALAASPSSPPGLEDALVGHADLLVPLLQDGDGTVPPQARRRMLRAVGRGRLPAGRRMLVAELVDSSSAVRREAAHSLAAMPMPETPDLPPTRQLLVLEAARAAQVLAALDALPTAPGTEPLARALRDELDDVAERVGAVLALTSGGRALAYAATLLRSSHERGLALELIEVATGRSDFRIALPLLDPTMGDEQRRDQLDEFAPSALDAAGWVRDLVADPGGRWLSSWLQACALYAAPTVLGPDAADLAASWLDATDPVVAETARWAVGDGRHDRVVAAAGVAPE